MSRLPASLKRFALLSLGAWVVLTSNGAHARVVEKIAAVVGDEIVLASEVEEKSAPFMQQIAGIENAAKRKQRAEGLKREVLERLIDDILIEQQAREFKLTISSEDVDRSIDQIKRENNLTDDQLRTALAGQGMSMMSYRQDVRRQVLRFKVLGAAIKATVSERDLQSYYNRHIKSGTDAEVRASHIFIAIPDGADTGVVVDKRKQAEDLLNRAKKGEDFAKLAREYTEDPATREDGGDLGYIGRDLLPKPIEEAVFSLKEGEIGGPVRASLGFHVIKVTNRRVKDAKPFEEVKEEIRAKLRGREVERETKTFLSELRQKALIDIRL